MSETTEVATQPAVNQQTSVESGKNVTAASVAAMLIQGRKSQEEASTENQAELPNSPEEGEPESQDQNPQDQQLEAEQSEASEESEQSDDTQAETEDSDENSSLKDSTFTPKQQKIFEKRLGKEVAKTKAALEKLAQLEAKVSQLESAPKQEEQAVVSQPSGDNPLSHIMDEQSLAKAERDARDIKDWAREMLDRDDIDNGIEVDGRVYSKADLKTVLRNAEKNIERFVPERKQFLAKKTESDKTAAALFPWVNDKSSNHYVEMEQAFKARPYLRNDPESRLLVAFAIHGLSDIQAKRAAQSKAPAKSDIKPKPSVSQTAPSGVASRPKAQPEIQAARKVSEEVKKVLSKGNMNTSDLSLLLRQSSKAKTR